MPIEVRRKERESSENLIKRFTRRIQQSGTLMRVRRNRFYNEGKSKIQRRDEALYKTRIRKEIDRLKKLGKFNEESLRELRRKMKE
ncbi:MAG TPA: hypothetical protein VJL38_02365 [Patescibacteria group bacterium]|nr:hypothetical protein [Patescibacteria group bacterium]